MNKSIKRIIYTICFVLLCLIDQRTKTGTGLDGWIETFRDLTGVCMAVLFLLHYNIKDVMEHKIPYAVWTGICVVGLIPAVLWGKTHRPFLNDWIVILANIFLYGYVFICVFQDFYFLKKKIKKNNIFIILWLFMIFWMIISRSTYIWPLTYAVMFGILYIIDYSKEEQADIFGCALNGIIIFFLLAQAFCCVFRPYDSLRYVGAYHNCNLNALFYLEVLVAVYTKILIAYKNDQNNLYKIELWLLSGAVNTVLFMTVGRTAWGVAVILTVILLFYLNIVCEKKELIKNAMKLITSFIVMFPICFVIIRYVPPVFHHPVWFWGEWNEEKVHSFDPWNSDKYVDFDELMDISLGRIEKTISDLVSALPTTLHAYATEADVLDGKCLITYTQSENNFFVRKTIYKYYAERLNMFGHNEGNQGFQLIPGYRIGHAHNIYLQYGTDFGVPAMVIFIILIVWSCAVYIKRGMKGSIEDIAALMFILVPALFGILEYSWGVSSLTITMMFMVWRRMAVEPN